jgi:hypothetical protein
MKLALRNQKFSLLRIMLSIILIMLAFQSESAAKTIPTDAQFKKNPIGMCGRACQNLISCQKDEALNKKCRKFCPKSGCVKRGKKPEESMSPIPDDPSQTQESTTNGSS